MMSRLALPICPRFPLTLALSHGGERGFASAHQPKASPANIALLVRVPLRFAKGRCAPLRPGHTPLASLRLLAPLSRGERGYL